MSRLDSHGFAGGKARTLLIVVVLAGVVALAAAIAARQPIIGIAMLVFAGATALLVTSNSLIVVLSLGVFIFIPVGYVDLPEWFGRYFTPTVLLLGLWTARLILVKRARVAGAHVSGKLFVTFIFAGLALLTSVSQTFDRSWRWTLVIGICWLLPALFAQTSKEDIWPALRSALAVAGILLGILAVLEVAVGFNPWMTTYLPTYTQYVWSAPRARVSMGHPLTLMVIASAIFSVCLSWFGQRRSRLAFLGMLFAGMATILTVSRSGVLAIGVGLVVGLVGQLLFGSARAKRAAWIVLILGVLAVLIALQTPLLQSRNESGEGIASILYRTTVFNLAVTSIQNNPVFGLGPGSSAYVFINNYGQILESSPLQLLVSTGIPMTALILGFIGWIFYVGAKRGRFDAISGFAAFLTAISGYNPLDSNPAIMALGGFFIIAVMTPRAPAGNLSIQHVRSADLSIPRG